MENSLLSDRGRIPLRMPFLYRDNYRQQNLRNQLGTKQTATLSVQVLWSDRIITPGQIRIIVTEVSLPSGSSESNFMEVQVLLPAPKNPQKRMVLRIFLCFSFFFYLADASERCFALWLLFTKICIPYCAFWHWQGCASADGFHDTANALSVNCPFSS